MALQGVTLEETGWSTEDPSVLSQLNGKATITSKHKKNVLKKGYILYDCIFILLWIKKNCRIKERSVVSMPGVQSGFDY